MIGISYIIYTPDGENSLRLDQDINISVLWKEWYESPLPQEQTLTPIHLSKALPTCVKGENTDSLEAALPIVSSSSGHTELMCAGV